MDAERAAGTDARQLVGQLVLDAVRRGASDLHLEPTAAGYELRFRVDGLLTHIDNFDAPTGRMLVQRLMVLAELLTYRLDVPQEGRCVMPVADARPLELRVAVMPTTHGLRAVVRLPAELLQPRRLEALELPEPTLDGLKRFARSDSGMLLLSGPAGSGKTTTIYALLEHILEHTAGLSIISLEDPVERDLPGVTQIQVQPFGELSYESVLRSVLRQDPQVLMLGEIRDAQTASIAVQAALSGHRLVSTLHAGTPEGAVVRLLEMGLQRYQVASSLFGVAAMRLVRRGAVDGGEDAGYAGRMPVTEFAWLDETVRRAVLDAGDSGTIRRAIEAQPGFSSFAQTARHLIERGVTDEAEVRRVLGDLAAWSMETE